MTLKKPEDKTIMQWCMEGLNLKTVVVVAIAIVSSHFATQTKITVMEQDKPEYNRRFDEVTRRLDSQRDQLKEKVDKEQYEQDQRRLAEELSAIQTSTNNIETILMEHRK